jgi:hypothetical protein
MMDGRMIWSTLVDHSAKNGTSLVGEGIVEENLSGKQAEATRSGVALSWGLNKESGCEV